MIKKAAIPLRQRLSVLYARARRGLCPACAGAPMIVGRQRNWDGVYSSAFGLMMHEYCTSWVEVENTS